MNDGLGGPDISLAPLFWVFGIAIFMVICFAFYSEYEESQTVYKMPNGIICESKLLRGGGFMSSGSTFEFRQCNDGKKYINPEHFREIRK